jgi:glycosyltransferase involved in cell wall biosynthesis
VPSPVAFVPLRYGREIVGGSEALTREAAIGLAARGWEVEVLTSRVIDHYSWEDELPEGVSVEDGVTIRRFSSVRHHTRRGREAQLAIQHGTVPPIDDQWTWVSWRYSTPDLHRYLLRQGTGYSAVVFSPYLFWNATACLAASPSNAVVMPCLHDETYARLDVVRPVLASPRSVWFLSEPEHRLAHRLGSVAAHHVVTGAGIHPPASYDPDGFRRRHGLHRPFLLYAGRREAAKGWEWLVDTFAEAARGGLDGVDLVTVGAGEVRTPPGLAGRVIDLGFVSEAERNDAFAAALAYVQPSRMESFSRTVMEAWLAGTPVLVVKGSEVVEWHVDRSAGGFSFGSAGELAAHVRRLQSDAAGAGEMAAHGRRYAIEEYSWPVVLDRMEADLEYMGSLRSPRSPAGAVEEAAPAGAVEEAAPAGVGGAPRGEWGPESGRVLVVGTYPPIPLPSADASVAAARRSWDAGRETIVVSPRLSAADLMVPVAGPLAGVRLERMRVLTSSDWVVLVVEEGFPFTPGRAAMQLATAAGLRRSLRRFRHVTVVLVGSPRVPDRAIAMLRAAADEVLRHAAAGGTPGVTPLGPAEATPGERPVQLAASISRRVLGRHADPLRARLGQIRRQLRERPGRNSSGG